MSTLSITHDAVSNALCDNTPLTSDQRAALLALVIADKRGQDLWDTATQWQPIATAPDDDRAYLVFDPHPGYIAIARRWLGGWHVGNLPGEEIWPTHWMRLPGHPAA